jgi:uncharacterized protein
VADPAIVAAVVPSAAARSAFRPLSAGDVSVTGGFWSDRAALNRERTIPAGFDQLQRAGTLHNFALAASAAREGYRALGMMFDKPFPFLDSDVYKWLEGVGWALAAAPDARLTAMADEAIGAVEAAQRPDGYLNTFVQVLAPGSEYRDLAWGHELYCYGHLLQAAIAWHRGLGDDRLLGVAERAVASVNEELGPGGREAIDGHPEIEMGLVELYRATDDPAALELARTFIERRGGGSIGPGRFGRGYWQDHLPVRSAPEAVGHAVRHLYLDAGAVDVAVETRDDELLEGVHRRWRHTVETKMYLTGAMGSRHKDEAFGDAFELPPDRAYAETCAAIASVMLAWRLLLATGDPTAADVIERTVYNGVLSSLSADGTSFFYVNPLQRRTHRTWAEPGSGERAAWYACACCPPNLMRLIGSWPQMLATTTDDGVQVHQYVSGIVRSGDVELRMETAYPWSGDVAIEILAAGVAPRELAFRVPGWCASARLEADGTEIGEPATDRSAIVERRVWHTGDRLTLSLDMPARVTAADPRVDAIRGCVALERGPLVYAIETADLPDGVELEDVEVPGEPTLATTDRGDLGTGYLGLTFDGRARGRSIGVPAIPYHAWGNRRVEGMRVWIPRAAS